MFQGGALPQLIHQVALVNELAEFHLLILVVIGHVVIADEIGNSGDGDGRFEDPSLREQPVGQLSAVTGALDPEPAPVDPEKTPQSSADGVKHILALVALLLEPVWVQRQSGGQE